MRSSRTALTAELPGAGVPSAAANGAGTQAREGTVISYCGTEQAERAILQDMPTVPVWYQSTLSAWSTRLRNVQPTRSANSTCTPSPWLAKGETHREQ